MIINETYTIRIISSDNPANFITSVAIDNENICTVTHDGFNISVTTNNIIGETVLRIKDFNGKVVNIPVIVDDIIYSYDISYNDIIVNSSNPAIIYYNTNSITEEFKITVTRYSTLYGRNLLASDNIVSNNFELSYQ